MSYRAGDKVWVYCHARRLSSDVSEWRPGVILGAAVEHFGLAFYPVDVERLPAPIGSIWLARTVDLRPRDDGRDRGAWSDCAWRPRSVPA